jgi:hypothetical protein
MDAPRAATPHSGRLNHARIAARFRTYLIGIVATYPAAQQAARLRVFAQALPQGVSDQFGFRLTLVLEDVFWTTNAFEGPDRTTEHLDNLSSTFNRALQEFHGLYLGNDVGDNNGIDDDDSDEGEIDDNGFPAWFDLSVITREVYPPPNFAVNQTEAAGIINAFNQYIADMNWFLHSVLSLERSVSTLSVDMEAFSLGQLESLHELYDRFDRLLPLVLIPAPNSATVEMEHHLRNGLQNAERHLREMLNVVWDMERVIMDRYEAPATHPQIRICCQFERSRYRAGFLDRLACLHSPHLRDTAISRQPHLVLSRPSPRADTPTCAICTEVLGDGQPTVTTCCRTPFHAGCLLSWILQMQFQGHAITCPWCRSSLDVQFLVDTLEDQVRELDVL